MIIEKQCKSCEMVLNTENFTKSKNIKDGYENKCKRCRKEARKKYKNNCKICKKKFRTSRKEAMFCSFDCQGKARRRRVIKNCSFCNSKIEVIISKIDKHEYFYCNQNCRTEHLKLIMLGEKNPNYERVRYNCDGCSKEIMVVPSKLKKQKYIFCTNECYKEKIGNYFSGEQNPNYNHQKFNCYRCGKSFLRKPSANRGERVFCSQNCYLSSLDALEIKAMIKINCPICEKEFMVWKSRLNYSNRIYCSKECVKKGHSLFYSGVNSPNWNHKLSEEERLQARKYEDYYNWRKKVFERDNYTCQCCGDNSGGNLVAHHILNYSEHEELRTELSNGITLCDVKCHKTFHDTYGYNNNNKEQLNEFIRIFNETPFP